MTFWRERRIKEIVFNRIFMVSDVELGGIGSVNKRIKIGKLNVRKMHQ